MAFGVTVAPAVSSAAEPELLTNSDFTAGTNGWVTNGDSQTLTMLDGDIAQLSTETGGSATLNDRPNSIQDTAKDTNFIATARIRTTTPNVSGALRVREVAGSQTNSSTTNFTLGDTSWQVITLNLTTLHDGSHLDFNLQAYNLPVGRNLQIDWVSVKLAPTAAPVPPPAEQQQPGSGPASCQPEALSGTEFGVTLDTLGGLTKDQAWAQANSRYGKPGIVRIFHPSAPNGWKEANIAKGSDITVSFKIQPKDVLSGANDAKLRSWFQSAPNDTTIYWTYFHEPEDDIERGAFTPAQYRAAWQRIHKIANETCQPNLHPTLILMGWTVDPRSGRDFNDYYPGSDYIDVLSWDMYNPWGGSVYKDPKSHFEKVVMKSKAEGKPFAIAETGSLLIGNDKGAGRAAWMTSMAKYFRDNKALYVSYFDTNQSGREFRLSDKPSQDAWKAATQS